MFTPQGAAANRICLIFTLFVADTKSQPVNEVGANTDLVVQAIVEVHLLVIILSDAINRVFQTPRLFILLHVARAFNTRVSCKLDVFAHQESRSIIAERSQPCTVALLDHRLPRMASHIANRDGRILPHINRDKPGDDSCLELASVRVLAATTKDARCLHTGVTRFL